VTFENRLRDVERADQRGDPQHESDIRDVRTDDRAQSGVGRHRDRTEERDEQFGGCRRERDDGDPDRRCLQPDREREVAGAFDEQFGAGVQEGGATGEQ